MNHKILDEFDEKICQSLIEDAKNIPSMNKVQNKLFYHQVVCLF